MDHVSTQKLVDSIIMTNYNIDILLDIFPYLLDNRGFDIFRHISGKSEIRNFDEVCRFLTLNSYKFPVFANYIRELIKMYECEKENISQAKAELEDIFAPKVYFRDF